MTLSKTTVLFAAMMVCFGFAGTATASHLYSIYNYPQAYDGASCDEQAIAYADRLATVEGVTVIGSLCEYDDLVDRNTIRIRYEATAPLKLVSTYTFHATYDDKGVYASEEACRAAIVFEEATFTSYTGLTPFISFCSKEKLERDRPWYVHIDAFGEADLEPSRASWRTDFPYGFAEGELRDTIAGEFEAKGLDLIHLTVRKSATLGEATVFYYGPREQRGVRLSSDGILEVPGLTECLAEARFIEDQFNANDRIDTVTAYCTSPYSNPTRFDVTVVYWGMSYFDRLESSESYPDLASCRTARERVLEQMRVIYGDKLLGGGCGHPRFDSSPEREFKVIALRTFR